MVELMDLAGRRVGVYLHPSWARALFNFEPGPEDELPWTVLGEIHAEQPGVGLWIKMWSVELPGDGSRFGRPCQAVQRAAWAALRHAPVEDEAATVK